MIITDLFEFFSNGYFYFFVTAFGLLLALGTLIISYLRTQKLPLIQIIITLVLLVLNFLKPILVMFGVKPEISNVQGEQLDGAFDLAIIIASAVLILADHVVYLLFTNGNLSRKSLFVLAPEKAGRKIYLYMDHLGKPALINKPFIDKLELGEDNKNWKKEVTNYSCDGNYLYSDFLKKLNQLEDGIVKFSIEINGKKIDYELEKITIKELVKEEEKVVGFIYVEANGEAPAEEEKKTTFEDLPTYDPLEDNGEEAEATEEEPAEEEKAEEPAEEPAEEEKAEEPAEEENKELSNEDLNNIDLDNSFLNEEK